MGQLSRKLQKIFGGSLSAPSNIAKFGSLAAGSPAYSLDPDDIQALAQFLQGWAAATVGNSSPALQDRNALDYLFSRQLAYVYQAGIPEWDATTEYFTAVSFCQVAGVIYRAKTNNTNRNPVTQTNDWETLASAISSSVVNGKGVAKAWVKFNGHNGGIYGTPLNVSGVTRLSTGVYQVDFGTPMTDQDYAWSGNIGAANGQGPTGGNNNILIGAGAQLTTSLRVASWESSGGPIGYEDCDVVTVTVFGN